MDLNENTRFASLDKEDMLSHIDSLPQHCCKPGNLA
jgi:hypothetical protein